MDLFKVFYLCSAVFGPVTLLTFVFSLFKPSRFTKNLFWILVPATACFLIALFLKIMGSSRVSGEDLRALILTMPPLPALLMSLSGTRALVDRCSPLYGIPLSLLNALGCIGLTLGLAFLFSIGIEGPTGEAQAYVAFFGGGGATVITLIYASVIWKKRFARKPMGTDGENVNLFHP